MEHDKNNNEDEDEDEVAAEERKQKFKAMQKNAYKNEFARAKEFM
jgi:hypothetical protein